MPEMGRPSVYSAKIAREICGLVSTCTDPIRVILESDERYPDKSTFYRWLQKKHDFRDMYARAKRLQLEIVKDEILDISDTPKTGMVITEKNGKLERRRMDMLEHRRLQIETRKWLLAKLAPKEYGDHRVADTGADHLNELISAMKYGPVKRGETNADN